MKIDHPDSFVSSLIERQLGLYWDIHIDDDVRIAANTYIKDSETPSDSIVLAQVRI